MAAAFPASTSLLDDPSNEKSSEDVVQNEPPSYQQLFTQPNTSQNSQCQLEPIMLTSKEQYRQPFVSMQPTPDPPIYSIKSHIVWSVLNMFCCCCLFGCVACCFSMKTKDLKKQGDVEGALKASKTAQTWNTVSTVFGIIMISIKIIHYAIVHG